MCPGRAARLDDIVYLSDTRRVEPEPSTRIVNVQYQTVGNSLSQLNVPLPVSEVHGLCCALQCALPSSAAKTRWFTEVLDSAGLAADLVASKAAQIKALDEWFGQTLAALNDSDLEFTPLLPDDDIPVVERMRALSDFCAGFTYGVGLGVAHRGNRALPGDTREIVEDFQSIESADAVDQPDENGEVLSSEKQEALYQELLEFSRVGVLLVLEELRPVIPTTQETLS